MKREYDVIVAGGGVGGLAAGALLAKAGKKVLLLEKKKNVGGRAATFKGADGVTRSMGQHAMLDNLNYDTLLQKLGINVHKEYFSDWQMSFEGKMQSLTEILPLVPERAGEDAMVMIEVMNGNIDLDAMDDISCKEFLDKHMKKDFLKELARMGLAIASTIPNLEEAAAGMYYETTQLIMSGMMMWISGDGMQVILEDIANVIKKGGGEVLTSMTVQNIIIENNQVKGVLASKTLHQEIIEGEFEEFIEFKAPIVVCNIPIWDVLNNVIPEEKLPKYFVDKGHNCTLRTANLGITAILPKPVYEGRQFFMALFPSIDLPGSIFMPTNVAPNLAPKGKHLFESSIICNYEDLLYDQKKKHDMLQGMKNDLQTWFPGWDKDAFSISTYFHYEEPKRAPGKSGRHRPGNSVPEIKGLYFSGDSYGSRTLPGMECASHSAMLCVEQILGKLPV
jgi:phytoene dehydrogenase-like protein